MGSESLAKEQQSATPIVSGERYSVLISTRVPHTLELWLQEQARAQGLSVAAFVRHELYALRSRQLAAG